MILDINDAFYPFLDADQRIQIFFGGSSSGKSVFLAQRCVLDVLQKNRNYLIVRNVGNSIRSSVFNEVLKVIYDSEELHEFFSINRSEIIITCANERQILFKGLDDPEKLKSITPKKGVITDIWIEEATEITKDAYKQLTKRLRGESGVKKRIHFSFNPILRQHWIYQEFFAGRFGDDDKVYQDDDVLILKTTYKDNRFLEQDDIDALENETDEYWYNVYTLGNWGILGDVIFRNWEVQDLSGIRQAFDNYRNGLDFGFSNDPTALARCHYDRKRKTIYITDEVYERGLTNPEIAEMIKPIVGREYVVCDSAEPKSIKELKQYGINAIPAQKGKDSVLFGIQWLQQHKIIIDRRCQNTINEFQLYQWRKDKDGNVLNEPIRRNDHAIDALRYALEREMETRVISGAKVIVG